MSNILEEYLVKVGISCDEPSFGKLNSILARAESSVTSHTSGMVKHILEAQGAIVGAFASMSSAIVGLIDKAAMLDQSWRLQGQKMMMTMESARKYDLITKALGMDLGAIFWDPESHARADEMGKRIDKVFGGLDESKLKSIRDIRTEFSMLGIDLKALGQHFAVDLFTRMFPDGKGLSTIQEKMKWFEDHISQIADKLAKRAVPILKETWVMVKGIGDVLAAAGTAFTNFVGLLSGDSSIKGTTLSFENMAKAVEHVEHFLVRFFSWITNAEKILGHFASGVGLMLSGKFSEAGSEFKAGLGDLTGGSGAILGVGLGHMLGVVGGGIVGGVLAGPAGIIPGSIIGGALVGPVTGGIIGYGAGKLNEAVGLSHPETPGASIKNAGRAFAESLDVKSSIIDAAKKYQVSPALALAIADQETGGRFNADAKNKKSGALGVMQLMPGTAKDMGVDRNDPFSNIEGGVKYLKVLMDKYHGDTAKVAAAYNFGMGNVDRGKAYPAETRAYVPSVMAKERAYNVQMGGIFITQPGADEHQIRRAVADGVREGLNTDTMYALPQLAPAWGG